MHKIRITLICLFISNAFIGQDISIVSEKLIVLQQNIQSKSFDKAWKKNKKSWKEECSKALSIKELLLLFDQLAQVYSSETGTQTFKMDQVIESSDELRFTTFCEQLIRFEELITKDNIYKPDDDDKWKNQLIQLIESENIRIEEEKSKKYKQIIANMTIGLEANYLKVFEGAKKGSFQNIRTESSSSKEYGLNIKFNEASVSKILVDEDDVYQFMLVYPAADNELAHRIQETLISMVENNLPTGFKRGKMFNGEFLTGFVITFDFQGIKFAETAKHPTIEIGINKNNYNVSLMVIEPLFRR